MSSPSSAHSAPWQDRHHATCVRVMHAHHARVTRTQRTRHAHMHAGGPGRESRMGDGDKAMPTFGLPLLSVAIFIAVNNANGNTYVLAFANALDAMQKLKQCGSRVHTRTHGVAQARFGCVARTCVYIYNPQGLYNSPLFCPMAYIEVFLPCIIIRPLVTAVERGSLSHDPCILVLTTVN